MVKKSKQEITAMILAVLVSFFMWIYVMAENDPISPRVIYDVPVTLTNTENIEQSNLALSPNQAFTVNISITGGAKTIYALTPSSFKLEADMSGYLKKGENNIPVEIKDAPNGISIKQKNNLSVRVKLDSLAQKTVPIRVETKGEPKDGYGTYDVTVKQTEASVLGPQDFVNQVNCLKGQIDITNAEADVTGAIQLKAYDKDDKLVSSVSSDSKSADAYVSIKPAKIVPVHINTTGKVDDKYTFKYAKPKTEKVKIIGDRRNLDKVKQIESFPFDISRLTSNYTGNVQLNIPSGIIISGDIKSVSTDFYLTNKTQKTVTVPITASNQKNNLSYQLSQSSVSITLTGDDDTMASLDTSTITATIDVGSLAEGNSTVDVKIAGVPGNVTASNQNPQKVQVTVAKK